jgi:hypothetical protein
MTKQEKLLASIRNNPKVVRFDDACKIAERLGFSHQGGKGSHRTYGRMDEPLLLNFQNRDGYILPYQAKQLLTMVDKYAALSD